MAIPLIIFAVILFAAAYQDQVKYLAGLLEQDFAGYFKWLLALMAILAIGLIPKAKPVAISLLGLVILVIFVKNQGFFSNVQNIQGTITPPPPAGTVSQPDIAPGSGGNVQQTGQQVQPNQGGSAAGGGGTGTGLFGSNNPLLQSGPGTSIFSRMFGQ